MSRSLIVAFFAIAVSASACRRAPEYRAEVKLDIDGATHDYSTTRAQLDRQLAAGRTSLYLLPAAESDTQPYLCLRTYAGNPVAHLWVRYPKPDAKPGDDLGRFECFVPGTLSNGTETLTWTHSDGRPRDKTDTGQPDCAATVTELGDRLLLEVDALMHLEGAGGKKSAGEQGKPRGKPTIRVAARAALELGSGRR
jgi:hypothetical protein